MDLAAFRLRFPEFSTAEDEFVQAFLDAAAKETSAAEFGEAYDEAHGLLAAHKMAISPLGQSARILNDQGRTSYELERSAVTARAVVSISTS